MLLIAAGISWWQFPNLTAFARGVVGSGVRVPDDPRAELFAAFTRVSDHVAEVGTPEQKAAMLVVLPAIVEKAHDHQVVQ